MSYYSDASLVMIPSGVKDGTVFSQKPLSADGQLTFTRASSATRVNSSGLVEKVRTNLSKNSQTGASWTASGSTVDSTTTADPLGGTAAVQFTALGGGASNVFADNTVSITSGTPYAGSVYVKNVDANYVQLTFSTATFGSGQYRNFDLTNGTIGGGIGLLGSTIEDVGGGWYRISIAATATASASTGALVVVIVPSASASRLQAATAGQTLIAFGIQLETGDIATDYIATTSAAVSVGPVSGLPRLDYSGGATCPSLLLEPQRTNSITSSENISTGWTYTNTGTSVNQTASPDGYANADAIIPNATSGQHAINSANITASGSFTLSAFVKAGEYTKVAIRESANTGSYASFNLATGTKIEDNVSGASFIQSYGNGWYRIGVTGSYSGTIRLGINVLSNAYTTGNPSSGTTFFSGNASDKLFCWGMQAELGATYATSYIPTLSTAQTRVADAASKTGISSLIGQTEGVLFVDFVPNNTPTAGVSQWLMFLGGGNNYISIYISNQKLLGNVAATTDQCAIFTSYNLVAGTRYKAALAYKANDFAFYVNGVLVGTDTSGTVPAVSTLQNNYNTTAANSSNAGLNQALLFPTRLSNADLATLTTL